jgi:hypothetical protein
LEILEIIKNFFQIFLKIKGETGRTIQHFKNVFYEIPSLGISRPNQIHFKHTELPKKVESKDYTTDG